MLDKETQLLFKNYLPITMDYDEKIDGGGDYQVRDKMLYEKAQLNAIIIQRKQANRGVRKVRR